MTRRSAYPDIREQADGWWHAWVTVGTKQNGRADRRHVKRETYEACKDRVDELLAQARAAAVVKPGRSKTLRAWLDTYLETVAPRRCDPTTIYGYRSLLRNWVYQQIGDLRIDKVGPDQLDAVYLAMARAGKADSSVLKLHRILTRALEQAHRRGLVPRNVAKLIDSPVAKQLEIEPLTEDAAVRVLEAAAGTRNAARWSVGLALGLRQGEALGLRWSYVDLEAAEMKVWWQLHRRAFEHGCGGSCGRRRGGNCPQRFLPLRSGEIVLEGGLILKAPKGKSKRTIPIPVELVDALRIHREIQGLERTMAEGAWKAHDLVFARVDGGPVDPGRDDDEWKGLLTAAGVRDARLHDGRHTAGTLLLAQGVPAEVVQEILGHSDIRVTRRYLHVASKMARDATDGMGSRLLRKRSAP